MDAAAIAAARKRPGMYVGDTRDGSGARQMLWEVVANALDEHPAGRATRISVTLDADDTLHVDAVRSVVTEQLPARAL